MDEWSACRRGLNLAAHNIYNRQLSMPSAGFEPVIPASERPQTQALDRAIIGLGRLFLTILFCAPRCFLWLSELFNCDSQKRTGIRCQDMSVDRN